MQTQARLLVLKRFFKTENNSNLWKDESSKGSKGRSHEEELFLLFLLILKQCHEYLLTSKNRKRKYEKGVLLFWKDDRAREKLNEIKWWKQYMREISSKVL